MSKSPILQLFLRRWPSNKYLTYYEMDLKRLLKKLLRLKPLNWLVVKILSLRLLKTPSLANRIYLLAHPFPQTANIIVGFGGITRCLRFRSQGGKDQVIYSSYINGWDNYEKPLPQILLALCFNARCFIDIGANTGYYSLLASIVIENKKILAFEPLPSVGRILRENIDLNSANQKVDAIPVALSDRVGEQILYVPDDSHGLIETSASLSPHFREHHLDKIPIKAETLDHYLAVNPQPNVDLIKIDVESIEPNVLSGASSTIKRHRPIIILEIVSAEVSQALTSFLKDNRYVNYNINSIIEKSSDIKVDLNFPNHIFCPDEKADTMEKLLLREGLDCHS